MSLKNVLLKTESPVLERSELSGNSILWKKFFPTVPLSFRKVYFTLNRFLEFVFQKDNHYFHNQSTIPRSEWIGKLVLVKERRLLSNQNLFCIIYEIYARGLMTFSLCYHTLKYFIQVLSFVQGRIFYIVLYLTFFPKPLRLSQARGETRLLCLPLSLQD